MSGRRAWKQISGFFLMIAVVGQLARIMSLGGKSDETPFFSANDRSRMCTVASLVEDGTYEIDRIINLGQKTKPWRTIDMVRHVGTDGELHYYSSKPPLLSTLYAGVYWLIHTATGMKLTEHPFYVGRMILVVANLLPLIFFWRMCCRWIAEEVQGSWGRIVALVMILFGTFLTTFASTLSNHLHGAMAVGVSLAAWRAMDRKGAMDWKNVAIIGLTTAFATSCDMPALSWAATIGGLLLLRFGVSVIPPFMIGALPIMAGFFVTNYMAHQSYFPAYSYRSVGKEIGKIAGNKQDSGPSLKGAVDCLSSKNISTDGLTVLKLAARLDNWELANEQGTIRYAIKKNDEGWTIHQWGDWYDYPGSYWLAGKQSGVDRGEPSMARYVFQTTLGHHGILSLTPFWFLSILGLLRLVRDPQPWRRWLGIGIGIVTVVCLAFYWARPTIDRNYGGVNCCFRWSVWMIPLWFALAIEGLNGIGLGKAMRYAIIGLVAISLFSALGPWSNPWVHPWMYRWMEYYGWFGG